MTPSVDGTRLDKRLDMGNSPTAQRLPDRLGSVPRVLVADDQADVVTALRLLLRDAGFDADTASSVHEVRDRLDRRPYDLLLMDLNYARDTTSGREGLELLQEVRAKDPLLPVVVMTGWGSIDTAVEAMRHGARSFVHKPWDNAALAAAVAREVEDGRSLRQARTLEVREHQAARSSQRSLLPAALPTVRGCRLAARWEPAGDLGGDCYDAVELDNEKECGQGVPVNEKERRQGVPADSKERRQGVPADSKERRQGVPADGVAISIADVCGKGLPAALVMAHLQASTRAFAAADARPASVAANVNRALCRNAGLAPFVTFFYATYDAATHRMAYTNAGHNPPLLMRADGSLDRLTTGGMVLGVFEHAAFAEGETTVSPGDRVVLFTDGITEATDERGDEFGDERLVDSVLRRTHAPLTELVDGIFDDVAAHAGRRMTDDATVVVLGVGDAAP